jgi:hypothetical protein
MDSAAMLAFKGVSVVDDSVVLSGSTNLVSLEGLNRLSDIGGDLILENHANLVNLSVLDGEGLSIGGDLIIRNNGQLTSIASLANVVVAGVLSVLSPPTVTEFVVRLGRCIIGGNPLCPACTCQSIGLDAYTTSTSTT